MAFVKHRVDASNFPPSAAKPFMNIETINPTKVVIKVDSLLSRENGVVTLKLSEKKGFPYLLVNCNFDGINRNMIFFGSTAEDLINTVELEERGTDELVGFMSFASNSFKNEAPFADEPEAETVAYATLSGVPLKQYAISKGLTSEDLKGQSDEDIKKLLDVM